MTSTVAPFPAGSMNPETADAVLGLENLRLLLVKAAEALSACDGSQVQQVCNDLSTTAVNLRPAFQETFASCNVLGLEDRQQPRRRLLLTVLEARAFYLAALRRYRRSLSLRRSLLDMQRDVLGHDETEVSRWY